MGVVQPARPRSVWSPAGARALFGKRLLGSGSGSGSGRSLARSLSLKASRRESAFLQGLRPALTVAQVLGLLPVAKASDHHHASFKWKSFRVVFSMLIVMGSCAESALSLMRMLETGVGFITSVNVIFYTTAMIGAILFLSLGPRWRGLLSTWASVEFSLVQNLGTPLHFKSTMLIATCVLLSVAAVEHVLSVCNTFIYVWPCYERGGVYLLIQGYFLTKYMKTFTTFSYSLWKAMMLALLQVITTFVWNFLDLFVMLLSIGISAQFRKLNVALEEVKGQTKTVGFWRGKREIYNSLCSLAKHTDSQVGPIILLSYASNLYFICLQCIVVTKKRLRATSSLHFAYFYFSLMFLILRTGSTAFVTALVYEESKKPKDILYSVPSEGYSPEVQRFLTQVTTDTVAFSGCNFFSVTRSFILTVAGTVVTYLVVLVQFENGATDPDAAQSNNSIVCTCADIKVNC